MRKERFMKGLKRLAAIVLAAALSAPLLSGCSAPKTTTTPASKPAASSEQSQAATSGAATSNQNSALSQAHGVISITDAGFEPQSITVTAGKRVVWSNDGQVSHQIDLGGGKKSQVMKPGDLAAHVFTTKGKFPYVDALHPEIKGVVIVK